MNRLRQPNATIEKPTRARICRPPDSSSRERRRRCQFCGSSDNLQVRHQRPRGKNGDDCLENLITLCASCHRNVHGGSRP